MKQMLMLVLLLSATQAYAQGLRVIAAAGNTSSGAGGLSLSYTVGETAIAQRVGPSLTMREGFWQPGLTPPVAVVDIAGVFGIIRVFPNPTSGQFTLDLGEGFPFGLRCTLFNALGVVVESKDAERGQSTVILGDPVFENGLYLLQLQTEEGKTVHTLRVLKI